MRTMKFSWLSPLCWVAVFASAGIFACSSGSSGDGGGGESTGGSSGRGGSGGKSSSGGSGGNKASGGSGGNSGGSGGSGGGSGGSGGGSGGVDGDAGLGQGDASSDASDAAPLEPPPAGAKKVATTHVMTFYSFQDNTPVNSMFTGSGRVLKAFTSVAVPGRELKQNGGTFSYGDKIWVQYLAGRTMPNGKVHSGWVQIDDFCGDGADDSYCFQQIKGVGPMYPNVDLYIGDFSKSGFMPIPPSLEHPMGDCTGPSGTGLDLTDIYTGTPAKFETDYGGSAVGTGKCGDRQAARDQQFGPPAGAPFGDEEKMMPGTLTACWGYDGQGPDTSSCSNCKPGVTCAK